MERTHGSRQRAVGRRRGSIAALVVALAAALTGLPGCSHNNPLSFSINGNALAVREAVGPGVAGECYPLQALGYRSHGTLDLMVHNRYEFFPELENLMPPTQSATGNGPAELRLDAAAITVTGAEVELRFSRSAGPLAAWQPTAAQTKWYVPFNGLILPRATLQSRFPVLPSTVGEQLRARFAQDPKRYTTLQRVVLAITVEGEMRDGTAVKTQTIDYPIDLCWGCLVHLPVVAGGVGAVDPEEQYRYCTEKTLDPAFLAPCVPGNDEYVPCGYYCGFCDLMGNCDEQFCPEG